jgi:hypothetical protein
MISFHLQISEVSSRSSSGSSGLMTDLRVGPFSLLYGEIDGVSDRMQVSDPM